MTQTLTSKVGQLRAGFGLLFESFGMLRRERALWALAWVPLLFSLLAVGLTSYALYAHAGAIHGMIDAALPVLEVEAWYQWLWLGPARLVVWLTGGLLFALFAGLCLVLALMGATIAASPFLDALSQRTERIVSGGPIASADGGLLGFARETSRSMIAELQRLGLYGAIWTLCFVAGLAVPGAHLVTGPLMVGVTILFLPLEYAGYSLDRRQLPFRRRTRWLMARLPTMVGFGTAALVACFLPVVNIVMIPILVVAGTLLVLRHPPA